MKNKQIFDYREPFNAPYMIRELAKNVKLPFVVYAQDFTIATISFALMLLLSFLTIGLNQIALMVSIGVSYGMVQLFNRVEPDGKRVDLFLKDYFSYLWTYVLPRKVLYHEQLETFYHKKVVYNFLSVKATIKAI
ncbi:TcpE family conjugal transfer membrane protein [Enterococcus sp. UD-01]|jgi:hypothetical protein|uniref:TcpE family conjugal transfer membrane protein n=1 Tax=Enterococcus sp. UD-01 TaxID=3373911 RepID=UPI0038342881